MSLRERFRLEEKELENLSLKRSFPFKGEDDQGVVCDKLAPKCKEEEKVKIK